MPQDIGGKISFLNVFKAGLFLAALSIATLSFGISTLEVKLKCQLEIEEEYFFRRNAETVREKRTESAIVQITERERDLLITVDGTEPIIGAATRIISYITSYTNLSTSNAWDINNEGMLDSGKIRNAIRIDRNTGVLTFSSNSETRSGLRRITGAGDCTKVDTAKRKF